MLQPRLRTERHGPLHSLPGGLCKPRPAATRATEAVDEMVKASGAKSYKWNAEHKRRRYQWDEEF